MIDHSDLIERLVIPMVRERSREPGDAWHQAEQALSSQSLSLSEAREEIERLKGLVAASEAQRYRVCGELLARVEAAEQALKPFALTAEHDIGSTETDADIFQQMGQYNRAPKITVGDMRRALAALENGPAGLADATNDPSDPSLSSLRKGAEVVGEIVMFAGVGKEVSWRKGKMPPVGTKLCAHPPLTKEEGE